MKTLIRRSGVAAYVLLALVVTAPAAMMLGVRIFDDRVSEESVVWSTAQVEFELIRLLSALDRPSPDPDIDRQNLRLRADLLWSRVQLLQEGALGRQIAQYELDLTAPQAIAQAVDAFTAALPAAATPPSRSDWSKRFTDQLEPLHDLTIAANLKALAQDAREAQTTQLLFVAAAITWVVVVFGGAILTRGAVRAARRADDSRREAAFASTRLDAAIGAIPSGFALFDGDDRLVLCNVRFRALYPDLAELLRPGMAYAALQTAGVDADEGDDPTAVVEQALPDGRWTLAADRRVANGDRVSVRTEITKLKDQETELLEARDSAEAASRAKSSFIATMSHEIRTPMNGVLGTLELLSGTNLDEKQRLYANVAEKSARGLLNLLNDLLDLSKIEAGRLEVEEIDFPLQGVVESAISVFSAKATEKRLRLDADIAAELSTILRGDVGRLRQILLNLIGNAVKFTDRGFVRVNVRPDGPANEDGRTPILFEVVDTGVGVPETMLGGLFQEFNQLDKSYTRRYGGTGLGLAISKNLAELLGGEIGVDSRMGEGSRFWVRLPLAASTRRFDKPQVQTVASLTGPLRILLADDSEVNRMIAVEMLRSAGHEIDAVAHGVDAVNAVQIKDYDLVLMDVSMPQMDGREATMIIRSLGGAHADIPIIAMTAHTTAEDRQKCADSGMSDFVAKPLGAATLLEMVTKWTTSNAAAMNDVVHAAPVDDRRGPLPLLDLQALAELEEDTSAEAMPMLLTAFRTELSDNVAAVETALEAGDPAAVAAAAHPLKSSAGAFGCRLLQETAAQVERLAKDDHLADIGDLLGKLKDVGAQSDRAIANFLESRP